MAEMDNLILEHLTRFQAGQDQIERKLDEHTQRLGRMEVAIAGLRSPCDMVYLSNKVDKQPRKET